MGAQRARARAAAGRRRAGRESPRERARAFAEQTAAKSRFTGYETEEQQTTVADCAQRLRRGQRYLVKLAESPFYAAGGGQVADVGTIECEDGDCRARVEDVFRLGDDQVLAVVLEQRRAEAGRARAGAGRPRGQARHRGKPHRHASAAGGAARAIGRARAPGGLLRRAGQAALRLQPRSGAHRGGAARRRGSGERVDRDATTRCARSRRRSTRPSGWARWRCSARSTARSCGWCRSARGSTRASCAAARTCARTAEIGPFRVLSETSSAANVRRIEAVTGPAAVELLRGHDRLLGEIAQTLRTTPEQALEKRCRRASAHARSWSRS